jgi:Asp-tRNA(Asn)/Glu-tRNA(Gln) amidotransferase A subunit family amidase
MCDESIGRRDFLLSTLLAVGSVSLMGRVGLASKAQRGGAPSLVDLTASEVVLLLRSGDLSAERYAKALLEQCREQRALNAFIWQDEAQVLEAAQSADKRRNTGHVGPLHGLPILLKDNIDTADAPTTAGTPALRTHRPRADAPVAAALFSAGALLFGKTNMHELAASITSNNAAFGAVHNPYDRVMISGGSSGGNGAAIASRLCPAGLGTDTGGSIRIPSALCGIAGLRPTLGRYSLQGIVPYSHTRDTAGPMGRTVKDLVLLDSVVTGDDSDVRPARLKGLRIGVPRSYFFENLDSSLVAVVEKALALLHDAGCVLIEADIPRVQELYASAATPISYYEALHDLSVYLKESRTNLTIQQVVAQIASPDVKSIYETSVTGAQAPTQEAYYTAMAQTRPALQAVYREYFQKYNIVAVAFPTTVLPARPIGQDAEVEINGKKLSTFSAFLHNTRPMTLTGIPGLSLPIGLTAAGLPVGLEFDGFWEKDRDLLGLGLSMETLFGVLPAPGA